MNISSIATRLNESLWRFPKLHSQIHRAVAKVWAPPYLVANAEVLYGASEAVECARCADNRPLGENGTAPAYIRPQPSELAPAKFSGSRAGHPINQDGFRTALLHWRDALQILGVLRQEYMKRVGNTTAPLSYADLFALCEIGLCFPAYFLRRSEFRIADGELKPCIATVYKIVAGLRKVAGHMIANGQSESPTHTAEQLWEFTEEHSLLVSAFSEEVCPASDKLILKFLQVAIDDEDKDYKMPDALSDVPLDLHGLMEYTMDCVRLKLAYMIAANEIEIAFQVVPQNPESEGCSASAPTGLNVLNQRIKVLTDTLERADGEAFLIELSAFESEQELREMKIKKLTSTEVSNEPEILAALARTRQVLRATQNYSCDLQQRMNDQLGWETNEGVTAEAVWERISGKAGRALDALRKEYTPRKGFLSLLA